MCSKFRCSTNTTLVKHLFEVHSYEPSFMYACQIDNCPRAFMLGSTYSSFISHASRKHPNWRKTLDNAPPIKRLLPLIPMETVATEPSESSGEEIPSNTEPLEDLERMDYSADMPGEQYDDTDLSDGQKAAARFLLTLKERYRLSQVAVDFAVGAVKQIVSIIYENVKKSVTQSLEEKGLDIPTHELEGLFTPIDIFEGLETEYQQTKFYRDHFGLVVGFNYCVATYTH